ncbi:MAG: hypothetical protein R3C68_08285 [Myxococcota bacterium]
MLTGGGAAWLVTYQRFPVRYLIAEQPLVVLPGSKITGTLATLPRGSRVILYETVDEELALVRDHKGRAGYLSVRGLVRQAPASMPETAFADCEPTTLGAWETTCLENAARQMDSCRRTCVQREKPTPCIERCGEMLATCASGCRGDVR